MVSIRKYENKDRELLIELWLSAFPDDPPHNAPAVVIDQKRLVDDLIFVAVQENSEEEPVIVGACMAGYDGHRGWLYAVAVSKTERRQGLGKKLVMHSVDTLRQAGCVKINLQIRASNNDVAAFYKSIGFEVEHRMSMGLLL